MNATLQTIQTVYSGVRFRSRLEARWAVYFDELNIAWRYEFEGFRLKHENYVPDFWLPQMRLWAEVKPNDFSNDELGRCLELVEGTGCDCLLLVGPPAARLYKNAWTCWRNRFVERDDMGFLLDRTYIDSGGIRENPRFGHYFDGGNVARSMFGEQVLAAIKIANSFRFWEGGRS